MVEFWWVWLAAGGGVAVGMFLFAVLSVAADDERHEIVSNPASDALM